MTFELLNDQKSSVLSLQADDGAATADAGAHGARETVVQLRCPSEVIPAENLSFGL